MPSASNPAEFNQSNLGNSPLSEPWTQFSERLAAPNDRLSNELAGCWLDLRKILEGQLSQFEALALPALTPPILENFQRARQELGQRMLTEPLAQWDSKRPWGEAVGNAIIALAKH